MLQTALLVLVSGVALLTSTLVAAQASKAGMSCTLKSHKPQSSQRMCVYVCKDKSIEGRFIDADRNCAVRISSYG